MMEVKLWSEGYKCMKKGIFCRTESVAMMPKSRDHMPTTSLWGVTAKWPTRALKTTLILCPRDPQGYSHISLSLTDRILKEYRYSMGFAKSHWLKCSLHNVVWCGTARKSWLFELLLYKFNPLLPHCGSIAWELMHCYTWGHLWIVTVHGNTVSRHS